MIKNLILIILIGVGLLFVFNAGIAKQEQAECLQWQADSQQFAGWYATGWQVVQCKHYGIPLK